MKNDFADRLLGRTAAPAVRPLLPSFFEPVAGSTAQWAAPMGAVTETAAPTTSAGPSASRTPVQPDPDAPGVPSVTPVRASETPLLPANPTPIGSPLAEVRTVHASRTLAAPDRESLPERTAELDSASVPAPAQTAVPTLPTLQTGHPVTTPGAETARPEAPIRPPDPVHHAHPVRPAAADDQPLHPAHSAYSTVSATRRDQPVRPAAVPLPPASRRSSRMAAEPTVHISIGRVEVKATAEPAAPKRAEQPRRPVLSLDDYLRGRAGGARK
jgi:hypothetical protein